MLAQKEQNNSEASLAQPMNQRQWVEQKPCCLINNTKWASLCKEENCSTTINDESSSSELLYPVVHQYLDFFSVVVTAGSPLSRKGFKMSQFQRDTDLLAGRHDKVAGAGSWLIALHSHTRSRRVNRKWARL